MLDTFARTEPYRNQPALSAGVNAPLRQFFILALSWQWLRHRRQRVPHHRHRRRVLA